MRRFSLIVLALLLAGCGSAAGSSSQPAVTLLQWTGAHSGVEAPATRVVRNAADWSALWQQLDREAPPAPDWAMHMAVAVFLGQRRTAGYRVEVLEARKESGRLVLTFREHAPAPGRIVAQVLTSPWAVVVVPGSDLPVEARAAHAGGSDAVRKN